MKRRTLLLILAAIAVYLFFYFVIPVPMVHGAHFFWAFVGGISAGACLFLAGYLISKDGEYDIDAYQKSNKQSMLFIIPAVLLALVGSFVLSFRLDTREEEFLKKNSVVVDGEIINGVSTTKKNLTTYELTVRYRDSVGKFFTENISASTEQWENAGIGKNIKVAYERDHPQICKLLMNAEDALEYMDASKRIFPTLSDLFKAAKTKDVSSQIKMLGEGWVIDDSDDSEKDKKYFYNKITDDNLVFGDVSIYINEKSQMQAYNSLLAEAKQNMKIVYDSSSTNKRKGIQFENDSISIRFQEYSKMEPIKSEYGSIGYSSKKVYCFGFAKKNNIFLLPGDIKSNAASDKYQDMIEMMNDKVR
jgi:hypothetical protein